MFCKSTKNKSERPSLYISANFAYANSQSQLEKIAKTELYAASFEQKMLKNWLSPF